MIKTPELIAETGATKSVGSCEPLAELERGEVATDEEVRVVFDKCCA